MNNLPIDVAEVFSTYPRHIRGRLLEIRDLIFETAAATKGVGKLTETLKWGEPSYLTEQTKSGTTIRIGWQSSDPSKFAIYFHCRTHLVASFRLMFSQKLTFQGNRAIVFDKETPLPKEVLRTCVRHALTYKQQVRSNRTARYSLPDPATI